MADVFVILYPDQSYNVLAPRTLLYNNFDTGESAPVVVVETSTSFLGRYSSSSLARLRYIDGDSGTGQPETNPHWIGRYSPGSLARFRYSSEDTGVPQPETNPHFLARYQAGRFSRFTYNVQANDTPVAVQVETNPHFLGLYRQSVYSRYRYGSDDSSESAPAAPQPETAVSFLGRYAPSRFSRFNYNATDIEGPGSLAQPDTAVSFLGKFLVPRYVSLSLYRSGDQAYEPPVAETNTSFLAHYAPPAFARFRWGSIDEGTFNEIPTNFLARYHQSTTSRYAFNRSDENPVNETNVSFIGRYSPTVLRLLALLRQNSAQDFIIAPSPPEANPHFLGRFAPPFLRGWSLLRWLPDIVGTFVPPPQPLEPTQRFVSRLAPQSYNLQVSWKFDYNLCLPSVAYNLVAQEVKGVPFFGRMPAIAPLQKQTFGLDFGDFLPQGVTLTGVPALNISAIYGNDTSPASRVTSGPIIATIPGNDNGSGVTNTALLFQLYECLPNVQYLCEVVCPRSDGDIVEGSTIVPCNPPGV